VLPTTDYHPSNCSLPSHDRQSIAGRLPCSFRPSVVERHHSFLVPSTLRSLGTACRPSKANARLSLASPPPNHLHSFPRSFTAISLQLVAFSHPIHPPTHPHSLPNHYTPFLSHHCLLAAMRVPLLAMLLGSSLCVVASPDGPDDKGILPTRHRFKLSLTEISHCALQRRSGVRRRPQLLHHHHFLHDLVLHRHPVCLGCHGLPDKCLDCGDIGSARYHHHDYLLGNNYSRIARRLTYRVLDNQRFNQPALCFKYIALGPRHVNQQSSIRVRFCPYPRFFFDFELRSLADSRLWHPARSRTRSHFSIASICSVRFCLCSRSACNFEPWRLTTAYLWHPNRFWLCSSFYGVLSTVWFGFIAFSSRIAGLGSLTSRV
jgi:hypothetical protein